MKAWLGTVEARKFVTASSARWADRATETGTPETEARAAQVRTVTFYTAA